MMSSNSITLDSIEEREMSIIDVDDNPECCIYRVPKDLRKINEEAYTPQLISVGPFHHGNAELAAKEKQKMRYKREFGERIAPEKWQEMIKFIQEKEQRIRNCYAEKSELQTLDFVRMIFYDAVFIIELFLKRTSSSGCTDPSLVREIADIASDLQLLENQLPFFVLKELYRLAFSSNEKHNYPSPSFFHLSCKFFQRFLLLSVEQIPAEMEVKHFTDLGRSLLTRYQKRNQESSSEIDLPGAVKLRESGLKFSVTVGEGLNIRFKEKRGSRISCYLGVEHELQIPRIGVYDQTECVLRNLMALEQCHYPEDTIVCNYADLMDKLIDTVEDVNLLAEAGIISNNLGESARIATMFNKICLQIGLSDSHFYTVSKALKDHYENRCNHARATLIRVYFNNPWRGTATVAAVVLLVLTVIQTVCNVLQVLH